MHRAPLHILLLAAFSLAACGKVSQETVPTETPAAYDCVVRARAESGLSKAGLSGNGAGVWEFAWEDTEQISVWTDAGFKVFDKVEGTGSSADFAGLLDGATPQLLAVYPAEGEIGYTVSGKRLTAALPEQFTYRGAESAGPLMLARIASPVQVTGEDAALDFRHAAGLIRICYENIPVTAASFVLTADKRIAGEFVIDDATAADAAIRTDAEDVKKSVTVKLTEPVKPGTGLTFHIPIPTGEYAYFQLRVKDRSGKSLSAHQYSGPFTISRADLAVGAGTISITPKAVSSTGVDAPLDEENIYDLGHRLTQDWGIQQFAIDKDGFIYYASVSGEKTRIDKVAPSTSKSGSAAVQSQMNFTYSGHLTGMGIEDAPDGTYLWLPEYSDKSGSYYGMKTIGRVKFTPNAHYAPDNAAIEHYYLPTDARSTINVAVDTENDRLAVCFWEAGHNGSKADLFGRRIRIYSLSDAKALTPRPCTLTGNIAAGLGTGITARDLSELSPLAEIGTPWSLNQIWPDQINYFGWQGFTYHAGTVYFLEGTGNWQDTGYAVGAFTTYRCHDGFTPADNTLPELGFYPDAGGVLKEARSFIRALTEPETLKNFGITDTGYAEVEGVQVHDGHLYVGIMSKGFGGENTRRANVLKFSLPGYGEDMAPTKLGDPDIIEL